MMVLWVVASEAIEFLSSYANLVYDELSRFEYGEYRRRGGWLSL